MICSNCGATIEDGTKFCPVCGAAQPEPQPQPQPEPQPKAAFCPKCGQPVDPNSSFCAACGQPLGAQQSQQNQQYNAGGQYRTSPDIGSYFPSSQNGAIPTRSIGLYIVLSIVTCGLFMIYWMIVLVNDLNRAADTPNDTSGGVVYLLSLVTCGIYGIYWMFKAGEKVSVIRRKMGVPDSGNNGIIYLILQLLGFGIINYCLIQNEVNKYAQSRQ